jgi:hypothetical protein
MSSRNIVDKLVCQMWIALDDLSRENPENEMLEEDLDLWHSVTKHSAVQKSLDEALNKSIIIKDM